VFVTYLTGALYVHPLWFYKHQHDNRVPSKLFVACNNLQFRDTCGKIRNINLILDVTPQKEITWGCIWRTRCIVYDKLLKPRQSFRITLYIKLSHSLKQSRVSTCNISRCARSWINKYGAVTFTFQLLQPQEQRSLRLPLGWKLGEAWSWLQLHCSQCTVSSSYWP